MSTADWSPKTPHWDGDHLSLLLNWKFEKPDSCSVEKIIENSEKFPIKFPTESGRLKTIQEYEGVTAQFLNRVVNSVHPFVHESVLELFAKFLIFKRNHGTAIEKSLYKAMDLKAFINRLLLKRAVMFMGKFDKFLLIGKERGTKNWEQIGTAAEKRPQTLANCLSYDEIKLSALLYVSSFTYFVNKGDRKNMSRYSADRKGIEDEGIIVGLMGPRMKKDNVMDFQEIVYTKKQSQASNGYGESQTNSLHKLFMDFYDEDNLDFKAVSSRRAENVEPDRYKEIKGDYIFDNWIYSKRLAIVFDSFLLEADFRARKENKMAYLHVVGLGLGVWKISNHQEKIYMDTFYKRIIALGKKLKSISDVCFSYFNWESLGSYKNGQKIPIDDHPLGGIMVYIFKRQPHTKLVGEDHGKLLIVSYAWDGNALPGNEFWDGKLGSSGDSAAASSTQVAELHNPHIHPAVCADNLKVICGDTGDVLSMKEYQQKHSK